MVYPGASEFCAGAAFLGITDGTHSAGRSLCCSAALFVADDYCLSTGKPAVLCPGAVRTQ